MDQAIVSMVIPLYAVTLSLQIVSSGKFSTDFKI